VRVGIGRPGASKAAVKDFVLKDFGREEMITLKHGNSVDGLHASGSGVLDAACEAINQWIDRGEGSKAAKLPRPPRVKKPKNNLESVESSSDVTAS
jgi:peptidyl-tRNA hydrolase